ncbi:DUF488 family protein [Cytophagaceae bacterium ABcell3]|nr:DUF488 family protein [Cytophagaceae bacterium ABcell3]
MHTPEVGIESDKRQDLKTQADYDKLFAIYRNTNLQETIGKQQEILNLLAEYQRIALTCFEANICQCHRKHLAEAITQLGDWQYEMKHINFTSSTHSNSNNSARPLPRTFSRSVSK